MFGVRLFIFCIELAQHLSKGRKGPLSGLVTLLPYVSEAAASTKTVFISLLPTLRGSLPPSFLVWLHFLLSHVELHHATRALNAAWNNNNKKRRAAFAYDATNAHYLLFRQNAATVFGWMRDVGQGSLANEFLLTNALKRIARYGHRWLYRTVQWK